MYEIFAKLLKERGITPYKISKETGISTATLSDWKLGRSTPKNDKMQIIANYLGVSLEYLMKGEESENYYISNETREIAQQIFENRDMRTLFDMSKKMTPERLKAHIEFMKKLQDSDIQ